MPGGYLGDFTYQTHAEFYPTYCGLDINPYEYEGTTRVRFITILSSLKPRDQARVLQGVIDRFPLGWKAPPTKTEEERNKLLRIIQRLESGPPVPSEVPGITSDVVLRAIDDADILLHSSEATSAVDRVHTALHGYLIAVCDAAGIPHEDKDSIMALLKKLRRSHPKLANFEARAEEIKKILNSCGTIVDAINTLRYNASVAHPSQELLGQEEAMLVINFTRTLLNYLDSKLSRHDP